MRNINKINELEDLQTELDRLINREKTETVSPFEERYKRSLIEQIREMSLYLLKFGYDPNLIRNKDSILSL